MTQDDIHRAAREFRAIANLLSGTVPWTEQAKIKAEDYASYFEGLEALASHAPSGCPMAEPTCPMEAKSEALRLGRVVQSNATHSEAAAQPTGCLCDFCSQLRADWMEKYGEIEHNDH